MPCYEYECKKCGAKTELNCSPKAMERIVLLCEEPGCGAMMRRLYFPTPAVYKSEGFTKQTKEDK